MIDFDLFVKQLLEKESQILQRQKVESALLNMYFRQEGVFDESLNMAMVDVGWLGTTRLMVNELRNEQKCEKIPFFYLGVRNDVVGRIYGDFYSFFPPEFADPVNAVVLEGYYCSSKYPSTIGYKISGDDVIPIFKEGNSSSEQLASVHSEICCEIMSYIAEYDFLKSSEALNIWWSYINVFEEHPEFVDCSTLRKMDGLEGGKLEGRISIEDLLSYFLYGSMKSVCLYELSLYDTFKIKMKRNQNLLSFVRRFLRKS